MGGRAAPRSDAEAELRTRARSALYLRRGFPQIGDPFRILKKYEKDPKKNCTSGLTIKNAYGIINLVAGREDTFDLQLAR
jgi:hypothetical protein